MDTDFLSSGWHEFTLTPTWISNYIHYKMDSQTSVVPVVRIVFISGCGCLYKINNSLLEIMVPKYPYLYSKTFFQFANCVFRIMVTLLWHALTASKEPWVYLQKRTSITYKTPLRIPRPPCKTLRVTSYVWAPKQGWWWKTHEPGWWHFG